MKIIVFLLLSVAASASVTVVNYTTEDLTVNAQTVAASTEAALTLSGTDVRIVTPTRYYVLTVLDGSTVAVDSSGVTQATPLSVYLEIIWKGFTVGILAELFGLMLRTLGATRSRIGEVT